MPAGVPGLPSRPPYGGSAGAEAVTGYKEGVRRIRDAGRVSSAYFALSYPHRLHR